jgi:hypothetical protein
MTRPPVQPRKNSLRESAIPLRPTLPTLPPFKSTRDSLAGHCAPEAGRRRPSFKIDLPPRPIPAEIIHANAQSHNTPHPVAATRKPGVAQVTANNTALNATIPIEDDCRETAFRNPFVQGGEYIILQASPDADLEGPHGEAKYADEYPSPTDPWGGAGLVGLGYSLNRMRAPTPWIRGKEDTEWLNTQDMAEMEGRMRGMGVV